METTRRRDGRVRRGKLAVAIRAVSLLLIAGGLASLAFLNLADWHAQQMAEQHISHMQQLYRDANDPERLEYKRQAQLFNQRLAGKPASGAVLPYGQQLLYREEPMMSYLEVKRIALKLPIYHGVEENALMAGVGHWPESSLPVGGESTHCVLMGHSGMRNTRMFDDIRKLREGDRFVIWTLNEAHAYRVCKVETVLPRDVPDKVRIVAGRDLATLVTCTPYGVNSHRLLVHGKRCAYSPADEEPVGVDAYVNNRTLPLLAALALVAASMLAALASQGRRRGKPAGQRRAE